MPRNDMKKCGKCGGTHKTPRGAKCTNPPDLDTKLMSIIDTLDTLTTRIGTLEGKEKQVKKTKEKQGKKQENKDRSSDNSEDSEDNSEDNSNAAATKALKRLTQLGLTPNWRDSASDSDDEETHTRKRGKKSGRFLTLELTSKRKVDWPHLHVYKESKGATFDDMSLPEFCFGFASMLKKATKSQKAWLEDHFKDLMEDATLYKWEVVRNYHGVILTMIETGGLSHPPSTDEAAKIHDLRRQHIWNRPNGSIPRQRQGHATQGPAPPRMLATTMTPAATQVTNVCQAFQQRTCQHYESHDGMEHICAYCHKTTTRALPHPEAVCRRKQFHASKNGPMEAQS